MMLDFFMFKEFQKYPEILHLITTKSHMMPYSFSLALHTGEDKREIIYNRQNLAKHLQTSHPLHFIVANQTHSDNIKIITKTYTKGWDTIDNAIEDCDALITDQYNLLLTILTADCVPILLFDPIERVVAVIHAGWKGTKNRITEKTVKKISLHFGSKPENIIAGIAPSIGKCCYEVGDDVAKYFKYIKKSFRKKGDKTMLDLPYINKIQLLNAGLKEKHIEMSNICTACEVERFFSYRKEKGCSGRFMSIIGLKDNYEN